MGPEDAIGPTGTTVIDTARRLLADFSRCPSCAAVLPGNQCRNCGVDLSGPEGRRVGELSLRAAQLLTERDAVIRVLRDRARVAAQAHTSPPTAAALAASPTAAGPKAAATQNAAANQAAAGPRPPMPTPPLSPWSLSSPIPPTPPVDDGRPGLGVHGLLVGLGALLLAVAAVGFLVFSWRVLSLSGRAAVIAAATLGVLAVASWLRGRLPETAEAVGALGVVLVLADSWAIRRTGLFGADRPEGLGYAAAAAAVCALLLGGWALISRVRAGSWAAAILAPLAIVLLAARLNGELGPVPAFSTGFLLIAGLALGRGLLPDGWLAERWLLRASAAGALFGAGGLAGFGLPGPGRAALVLVGAALLAAGQALVDRPGSRLEASQSLALRRAWSLTAGLLAGTAAVQAGLALVDGLELDGVTVLVPLTALPALAALTAAAVPKLPGAAIRRTAFGAGTVVVAAAVTAPLIVLSGWLPLRAVVVGAPAWSADPDTRFGDLDPQVGSSPAAWAVALISLAVVGGCAVLAIRISGWPDWLRRSVQVGAATVGGFGVIVLPLVPAFPVVAVVSGLSVLSVLAAVLVAAQTWARTWLIAGWTASALTGTLAVLLAWSCRDLSVPFTALGIAGLLLARRRAPASSGAGNVAGNVTGNGAAGLGSAVLAALAGMAAPFAVGAAAGIAGAPEPQRVAWAGLVGGLSAAALIGLPRWLPTARPGRADWTGTDRLAAATPGLIAAVVGLLATLPDDLAPAMDGATWPRPVLLAVILLVALTGTVAIRPAVARAVPVLPLACAVAVTPLLGALAGAIRAAVTSGDPGWPTLSLLWAVAAGVGATATAAVVLSGRADPNRRLATEFGVIGTGLIGLGLVSGLDQLWPVLLVLGAAAAAIAASPDRQSIGWLAGLLLTGSTWSRLAAGNVTLVEAYSLPPACALLALALYRFNRDSSRDSGTGALDPVKALLPVATVGLVPSILVAARGPQARPAVLIAVAAVLVLAGWQVQRRGRLLLGATLAGIGVLTAAGTAGLRAGATLWELSDQATAPLAGVEVWSVPAALVLLVAAVTMKMIQPIGPLQRCLGLAGSPPALAALLLAGLPTLVAALLGVMPYTTDVTDSWTVVRAAVVLGMSALAALIGIADRLGPDRFSAARIGLVPGAITLTVAASWTGLTIGVGPIEAWTLPLAILLLIHGWSRFERVAEVGTRQSGGLPPSWPAYAPGLAVLLLPTLLVGLTSTDGSSIREIGLITLAAATVVVGTMHRLQAPILLGAGVLAAQSLSLLAPWIAELSGAVPLWGWVAAIGLSLLLFGADYEARMRQLRTIRLRLTALR